MIRKKKWPNCLSTTVRWPLGSDTGHLIYDNYSLAEKRKGDLSEIGSLNEMHSYPWVANSLQSLHMHCAGACGRRLGVGKHEHKSKQKPFVEFSLLLNGSTFTLFHTPCFAAEYRSLWNSPCCCAQRRMTKPVSTNLSRTMTPVVRPQESLMFKLREKKSRLLRLGRLATNMWHPLGEKLPCLEKAPYLLFLPLPPPSYFTPLSVPWGQRYWAVMANWWQIQWDHLCIVILDLFFKAPITVPYIF